MKYPHIFCLCWFGKIQQWLKDKFYDEEHKRYKHKWVLYLLIAVYVLHWLWHIAVGAAVVGFFYHIFS
ncbi:MAG: hypothetical protein HUK08_07070 [Bacteroidaceae bacterium]|nr:hypothetical protein [Bacteroidaceae bacterium]